MTRLQLNTELSSLPPLMQEEVLNFIAFLKMKLQKSKPKKGRGYGALKGKIKMKPGFDEPLSDFEDYI